MRTSLQKRNTSGAAIFMITILLALGVSPTLAQDCGSPGGVYYQCPDLENAILSNDYGGIKSAERFVFEIQTPIFSLDWWGGYFVGTEPGAQFTLTIYLDSGGVPDGVPFYLDENVTNTEEFVEGRIIEGDLGDVQEYIYHAELDPPFEAQAGQVYWIEIKNTVDSLGWLWESSSDGDGAHAWWNYGGDSWNRSETFDLAFALYGVGGGPVPTVSEWGLVTMTLLVLTAATLVFVRRRRSRIAGKPPG